MRGSAWTLAIVLAAGLAMGAHAAEKIKLGVMAGAEEDIAQKAADVAKTKGLDVQLVVFQDYVLPNAALDAGELDANAFQTQPYLDAQIQAHGYHIVAVGFTIVEPIGLYSKKVHKLDDLPVGAKIGIPNDPANGGRALNLLAANGLLTLAPGKGLNPSLLDVTGNPKKLKLIELDGAQLPRSLDDFTAAVVNTNHALNGGLDPRKDVIVQEPRVGNPYGNFVAARTKDKDRPALKILVESFQSKEVADFMDAKFKGAILPAW